MTKRVPRLFEGFQPEHYDLTLVPDAQNLTFTGTVTIKGRKTGRPSQRLTFHQKDLTISAAKLEYHSKKGTEKIKVDRINLQKSYDEVRLHSSSMLYPGEYLVTMEFSGTITTAMHGIYPCMFEHEGKKKTMLATQFESHHAREAFPCIDEPQAKATFDLTLLTPKDEVVIANTLEKATKAKGDLIETRFETTPRMSTYLLAFATGELHCVEAKTKDGTLVRTWSTVAQPKDSLQYANDEGIRCLEFFTEYFSTPFPLAKCDQIALPDFESGAMENWGLITYREVALLADPVNRSLAGEQYTTMIVAHEVSHQWFGNLVTMKWWDDLWLNESFASIMEYIAMDALHPDWNIWEQYLAMDVISASSRDIYKDVQPVRVEVNHPDEIHTIFDPAIVYAKGGRLLEMLRGYIGDDAFRSGLAAYFEKHAYQNTTRDDLWEAFADSSGKDIHKFMNPWLEQSGMPVVGVTLENSKVHLDQQRFVLDTDDTKSRWPIPLLANQPVSPLIFDTKEIDLEGSYIEPLVLNTEGSGHYIVHYRDERLQHALATAFTSQTISATARANALNDMMLLARGGQANLTDALKITHAAGNEPREAVWSLMSRTIGLAHGLTEGDKTAEAGLHLFRRNLATTWYAKLGWENGDDDSANERLLRDIILGLMIGGEDKNAISKALELYNNTSNIEDLPSERRSLLLSTAVRHDQNKNTVIKKLLAEYPKALNPEVQLAICSALTHTRDKAAAKQIIESALGENGFVRPQDIFRWYAYLMRNSHTRELAWDWLTDSWPRLEEMFGDSKSFDHFVVYSAATLNTPEWEKKFKTFFEPKQNILVLERNIKVAFSEIEARVAWRKREEPEIKRYLATL